MTQLYTIDLSIHMPDGGRHAKQLLNLYVNDMAVDIDTVAAQACDPQTGEHARKFARLALKRADVWAGEQGGLEVFAIFSVNGENQAFIKEIFTQYIAALPDYLKHAAGGYYPRSTFPPDIPLQPTAWDVVVH